MDGILLEVVQKARDFTAQNLANTSWAFAKLGLWNRQLIEAVAHAAVPKIQHFDMQGLANLQWSFAILAFVSDEMSDAVLRASLECISGDDFGPQELSNLAWAFDLCSDHERLRSFLAVALVCFLQVARRQDTASWADMANIAAAHGHDLTASAELERAFVECFVDPLLGAFAAVRSWRSSDAGLAELHRVLGRQPILHLGQLYTRRCLPQLGVVVAATGCSLPSATESRAKAREYLGEWHLPDADSIISVASYEVACEGEEGFLSATPHVVASGKCTSAPKEIRELLRPLGQRAGEEAHPERGALLTLLSGAASRWGGGAKSETVFDRLFGKALIYGSNHPCVSCIGVFCQFMRHVPGVQLECEFDSAWHSCAGQSRPITWLGS